MRLFQCPPVLSSPATICSGLKSRSKCFVEADLAPTAPVYHFLLTHPSVWGVADASQDPAWPVVPPHLPTSLPASTELAGLGTPRALVWGWTSSSLGHVVLEQVDVEWEGGRRKGFQAAENFPKVDALDPANFPRADGAHALLSCAQAQP